MKITVPLIRLSSDSDEVHVTVRFHGADAEIERSHIVVEVELTLPNAGDSIEGARRRATQKATEFLAQCAEVPVSDN